MKLSRQCRRVVAVLLTSLLLISHLAWAQAPDEKPSALEMTGDLLVARPLLLGLTLGGTAVYLVSLPFTLLGGNAYEAAETLVINPGKATFIRCLGCINPGYSGKDLEHNQ